MSAQFYKKGNINWQYGSLILFLNTINLLVGTSNGFKFLGDNFEAVFEPITGVLVDETSSNMNGRIVYMTEGPKSQFWPRVLSFIDRGVIGVIHGADYSK